jgi:hypothetical protein
MSTVPGAFVSVAPPADGLRLAFAAARRRRNTKARAAGAAGLLAVVVALTSIGGDGNRTLLQQPLPPASVGLDGISGVVPPTAASRPARSDRAPASLPGLRQSTSQLSMVALLDRPAAPAGMDHSGSGRVHESRLPTGSGPMSRNYEYRVGGADLTCPARKQQGGPRGLCTNVSAQSSSAGQTRISAGICNVGTASESLTYETARELDLSVRRGGREIWRWSTGRRFATTPHDLALPVGQCLSWTTTWAQVDGHGTPVGKGSYELAVDFDAAEVPAPDRHPSYSWTIS